MFHTRGSDHLEISTHLTPYQNTCLLYQKAPKKLSCMYQPDDPSMPLSQELRKAWPDITNFRITTNWCDRTIHHVCGISTKFMPARQLHNQPCTLPEKPGSSQVLKHIILTFHTLYM